MEGTNIITVAGEKGGIGKTTLVINLLAVFAERGLRCLGIDLDFQGNLTNGLGVRTQVTETGKSVARAIRLKEKLEQVRLPSTIENVDVLGATRDLHAIATEFLSSTRRDNLIRHLLDSPSLSEYDVVIIDTRGDINALLIAALAASHYYVIPTFAEFDSISGLTAILPNIEEIRTNLNPSLTFLGCVITSFDNSGTHRSFAEGLRNKVAKQGNFRVFAATIPYSKTLKAAASALKPVVQFGKQATPVTTAYRALADELQPLLQGRKRGRIAVPNLVALEAALEDLEGAVEFD